MSKIWLSLSFVFMLLFSSCEEKVKEEKKPEPTVKDLEDFNRRVQSREKRDIEGYIQRRKWKMELTGTGLRYMIYENGDGEIAKSGQWAFVKYEVKLIDGTLCYKTEGEELGRFLIGRDNVESGIHEGITYMRIGDKAKMILPMHLAHGLTGDNAKIPPQSTLFIDIELVDLQTP